MKLLRSFILDIRLYFLRKFYGMDIAKNARLSLGARLDTTYPKGIHIDDETFVARGAVILAHDFCRKLRTHTYVGKRCFIGVNAIVMPGVRIGDEVIVGSGTIITKDVPSHCIVVGNPARIIKTDISTSKFGQLMDE